MNDRYKYHEFYTGKENELEYKIVQLPMYKNINSENIYIPGLTPAVIKKVGNLPTDLIEKIKENISIIIDLE